MSQRDKHYVRLYAHAQRMERQRDAARDAIATARRLLQHERFHYSLHIAEGVSEIDAVLGVGAGDE